MHLWYLRKQSLNTAITANKHSAVAATISLTPIKKSTKKAMRKCFNLRMDYDLKNGALRSVAVRSH
jgi:hypothetical protein